MTRHLLAKLALILLVAAAALPLAGCPSSAYHSAVVAEHDFKLAVQSFQQAEIAEFNAGRISQTEHEQLESGVGKVALAGQALTMALQSGAVNSTVQQDFATLSSTLLDLLNSGVLGVKNAQSQQLLRVSIQTAQAILANVATLLNAPTTTTLPASTAPTGGN